MCDTNTAAASNEYRVPEANWLILNEKIDKLARKAIKLGLTPPVLTETGTEDVPLFSVVQHDGTTALVETRPSAGWPYSETGYVRCYHLCTLTGEAPVIPGWKLVAVVEHGDTEIGNVLRVAPGMECPIKYRTAGPMCDHCRMNRRRLETFVLLAPNGEYRQIGRNCLVDFCRSPEFADNLCNYAQILASCEGLCGGAEDEEFFGMGGRTIQRVGVESMLAMTARIIRHLGWCSRGQAREDMTGQKTATADVIECIFFDRSFWKKSDRESKETTALRDAAGNVEEKDKDLSAAALEWIRGMRPQAETLSDYLYNCLVVLSEETIQKKHFGIACSVVSSYQRHLEKLEATKHRPEANSEHFGVEGERERFKGILTAARSFESQFGVRYLYRFLIAGKDVAIWWSGKEIDAKIGDEVSIVGTVKTHGDYKGTKQTELSRCDVYGKDEVGSCRNCGKEVLPNDRNKACPHKCKRGVKVTEDCFAAATV